MKEKTKRNKGITLIALILTIIVLLILAVVAISAVKGDGIIGHAKNAKTDYTKAQKNEQDMLTQYEYEIEKSQGTVTVAYGEYATNKELNEKITGLKLGDKVNYTVPEGATYNGEWKVIGIENGQIKLVATSNVTTKQILGKDEKWNEETGSYKNAEDELDKICEEYLNKSYATEAKSIRIEDINKITSYNPPTPYELTFKRGDDGVVMVKKGSEEFEVENKYRESFIKPAETGSIPIGEEYTVKMYFYYYCLTGDEISENVFQMIKPENNAIYWLASSYAQNNGSYVEFGIHSVRLSSTTVVVGCTGHGNGYLWNTAWGDNSASYEYGVRPVVSLKSDVKLTKNAQGAWDIN